MNLNPLFWADDGGNRHHAPTMGELPLGLQLGITRMVTRIALSTAIFREGAKPMRQQLQLGERYVGGPDVCGCVHHRHGGGSYGSP